MMILEEGFKSISVSKIYLCSVRHGRLIHDNDINSNGQGMRYQQRERFIASNLRKVSKKVLDRRGKIGMF